METNYSEMYEKCKDFKEYVDRYIRNKDITVENALQLLVAKEYAQWLIEKGVY